MASYKSCVHCGRIHHVKDSCPDKPKRKYEVNPHDEMDVRIRRFRDSVAWRRKREEIQDRDLRLCQVCIRELYDTVNKYTYEGLSVHHIYALVDDWSKRLDNDNLITLCNYHHTMADNDKIPRELLLNVAKGQEGKIV